MQEIHYENSEETEELIESDFSSGSDPSQAPSHSQESTSNLVKGSEFINEADTKVVKNEITATNEPAGFN